MSYTLNNAILRIQVLDSAPEQDVFHQSAELFYVLEGSLEIRIGEQTSRLTEEDVFIVNVNKSYRAAASDNVLFVKITLPHQLISNAAQATHIQFWCDSSREENTQYQELRHTLKLLLDRYLAQRNPQKDFGYLALCYRLLDIVTTDFRSNIVEPVHMDKEERFRDRMDQINSYLHANYNQPLSSKELAEKLYLSQGYLSRFFRKNYGMSFAEYLTDIRLYHAVDDLLYTNMPITRIAFDNGFVNVTSFTKAFRKRYGATPSAIRKQRQEKELLAKSTDTDQAVEKRLDQLLRADDSLRDDPHSSNHVEQTCRGTAQTPLENIWCDTINVGPAAELLKSGVREHILLLTEMLHLQHVRFWNIFSKEMLIVPGEAGTYNFSKLDAVLDFLLENGLKPHMELGNKPRRLYRNAQNAILEEETVETFTETKEWEILFQSMMRHLRARYGSSQLNTWRLELWFDERAWGKSGANEDYFHRFNLIYNTAKSHAPAIEVGGCGLRIGFSDEGDVTLEFLRQWNRQPVRPDFLSMLYYPYDRGGSKPGFLFPPFHGSGRHSPQSERRPPADEGSRHGPSEALCHRMESDHLRSQLHQRHLLQSCLSGQKRIGSVRESGFGLLFFRQRPGIRVSGFPGPLARRFRADLQERDHETGRFRLSVPQLALRKPHCQWEKFHRHHRRPRFLRHSLPQCENSQFPLLSHPGKRGTKGTNPEIL